MVVVVVVTLVLVAVDVEVVVVVMVVVVVVAPVALEPWEVVEEVDVVESPSVGATELEPDDVTVRTTVTVVVTVVVTVDGGDAAETDELTEAVARPVPAGSSG